MKSQKLVIALVLLFTLAANFIEARADDFGDVVKMIEHFYKVKHQGIPFLAKAGIKAVTTAARIKGGTAARIAESGSAKVAVFEDQEFTNSSAVTDFRRSLNAELAENWMPFVQTLSAAQNEQTYIFLRDAGSKFNVLVINISARDATVVQVTVSPKNLALLMKDPDGMGKSITDEATIVDQE
jgi:hypothetical protein